MIARTFIVVVVSLCMVTACSTRAENSVEWQAYRAVEDAGYSAAKLDGARAYYEDIGAAAVMVVVDGNVLVNWGDTNRRYFSASIRKGFLNALLGIAIEQGHIDLDTTVGELGIDDVQGLTEQEKSATLRDLITAQSGIYHPGAFENDVWKERRPERGSYSPGEHWYYNNWDFNVLGYVYEQETGTSISDAFQEQIAGPLGMQDFRPIDSTYFEEPDVSHYPAYVFKMSARDMARFGLLYLNAGVWNDEQLVPSDWIADSLTPAAIAFDDGTGFGYLWWHRMVNGHDVYYAHGADAQGIFLVPDYDMVYVFRSDTYDIQMAPDAHAFRLLSLILDARTGSATDEPALEAADWPDRLPDAEPASPETVHDYLGEYSTSSIVGTIRVVTAGDDVMFEVNRGNFRVLQAGETVLIEDIEVPLRRELNAEQAGTADLVVAEDGTIEGFTLYTE